MTGKVASDSSYAWASELRIFGERQLQSQAAALSSGYALTNPFLKGQRTSGCAPRSQLIKKCGKIGGLGGRVRSGSGAKGEIQVINY